MTMRKDIETLKVLDKERKERNYANKAWSDYRTPSEEKTRLYNKYKHESNDEFYKRIHYLNQTVNKLRQKFNYWD